MADLPLLGVPAASPSPPAKPPPPVSGGPRWVLIVPCGIALALLLWRGYDLSPYSARPLDVKKDGAALSPIDLNHANAAELATLPGLGETLAARIVLHREENGEFASVEGLRQVKGIGPKTLDRVRPFLYVGTYIEAAPIAPAMNVPGQQQSKKPPPPAKIDINRATAAELQRLPGVGPITAARIIEERGKKPFADADALRRVKGIGAKTLDKLRPHVTTGDP